MNKSLLLTGVAIVAVLIGLGINNTDVQSYLTKDIQQPIPVPYVDINKYAGTWYEQAVIPYYFERGCSHTKAIYSLNSDGKSVKVLNQCTRNGKLVTATGKAIPQDSTNAKLKVQFVETLDIGAQYWITRLGKDYDYAVVTSPNYNYLWILYRKPQMPEDYYQAVYADLKKDGYPVQKLVRVDQS